jgi:hypothetical protein
VANLRLPVVSNQHKLVKCEVDGIKLQNLLLVLRETEGQGKKMLFFVCLRYSVVIILSPSRILSHFNFLGESNHLKFNQIYIYIYNNKETKFSPLFLFFFLSGPSNYL